MRRQYADERRLEVRQSVYGTGAAEPFHAALEALREVAPSRVLEVGGGQGFFAERLRRELGCEVVGLDLSPRMVELQRGRGIDARVGDVQDLPFHDGEFDAVVANYMLYHVADLGRAFAEVVRVLRPGGRFVAITNAVGHLRELWALVGRDRRTEDGFHDENGEQLLLQYFAEVERTLIRTQTTFEDDAAVRGYLASSGRWSDVEPAPFATPLVATAESAVFVASRAA